MAHAAGAIWPRLAPRAAGREPPGEACNVRARAADRAQVLASFACKPLPSDLPMPSTAHRAHECAICRRSFLAGETVRLYRDHPEPRCRARLRAVSVDGGGARLDARRVDGAAAAHACRSRAARAGRAARCARRAAHGAARDARGGARAGARRARGGRGRAGRAGGRARRDRSPHLAAGVDAQRARGGAGRAPEGGGGAPRAQGRAQRRAGGWRSIAPDVTARSTACCARASARPTRAS